MCLLETIASACLRSLPYPHRHDVDGKERTGKDAPARGAGFHPAAPDRAGGEARASSAAPKQTAIRAGILLGPATDSPKLAQTAFFFYEITTVPPSAQPAARRGWTEIVRSSRNQCQ